MTYAAAPDTRRNTARVGSRAGGLKPTTHAIPGPAQSAVTAPAANTDDTFVFHCPLWPECGCPGGVMRPECPGLKSRKGTRA